MQHNIFRFIVIQLCLLLLLLPIAPAQSATTNSTIDNFTASPITYASYFGSNKDEIGKKIAVDADGNYYLALTTYSAKLPTSTKFQTPTIYYDTYSYLMKLSASGRQIIYAGYLGSVINDLAVDNSGNLYVTGLAAWRSNFPATATAFQSTYQGNGDAFAAKISPDGKLIYATFLGGSESDEGRAITVDNDGNAYVTGSTVSNNFPVTAWAYQTVPGLGFGFVAKLNTTGNQLIYASYLGGTNNDIFNSIAVDAVGNAFIAGTTYSRDYPTTNGSLQPGLSGVCDAFITKLSNDGSELIYSTFLGGSDTDEGHSIKVDADGNAYITGATFSRVTSSSSSRAFPTRNAFQDRLNGDFDLYLAKLNPIGSDLIYSTYFGGSQFESSGGLALTADGNAIVTGLTLSKDLPLMQAWQNSCNCAGDKGDAFIAEFSAAGQMLNLSSYLGGSGDDYASAIAVDAPGNIYLIGSSRSTQFPVVKSLQETNRGGYDIFLVKLGNRFGTPMIQSASIDGKRLLINGENFSDNAMLLIDGARQKVANDALRPRSILMAKKANRLIAPGQTVILQVENIDGSISLPFSFTRN